MSLYRISVIIPSYKPKDYLWECLNSLQNQTLDRALYEVIIVLNGCKEPFDSRIREYLKNVPPDLSYSFIQLDEGGVSNARNVGLNHAKGEYIAFVDDDDYVSDTYLEELLHVSSEDTVGLCRTLAYYDTSGEIRDYRLTKEYDDKHSFGKQPFHRPRRLFAGPCMKLIHKSIIGTRRFNTDFTNSEDSLFMFQISDRMKWADFTSDAAVYFRRYRQGSAVMRKRSKGEKIKNAIRVINEETKTYFWNFPRYNFFFYVTRILGAIRGTI